MQALVLLVIGAVTLLDPATSLWKLPGAVQFVPELLSVMVTVVVILQGMRSGFSRVAPKYWLTFGAIALIILCSILTNAVGPGPILAGARYYLRAIPLFFLPAVYQFTPQQITQQLRLLLGISLLQVPIAGYQRWVVWSEDRFSGDAVVGTLRLSGVLSIFLICGVLVLTGLFMRQRLARFGFVALFFALLLPTTINETKATALLLPLGLLTSIVAGSPRGSRARIFVWGAGLLIAFGAMFVPIYDYFQESNPYKAEGGLIGFFANESKMERYMESKRLSLGMQRDIRRGDAYAVPLQYLSQQPERLAFGLGLGNASHSSLGEGFTGSYYSLFGPFLITSITIFMLEIGVLGTALILPLYWFVFSDSAAVAAADPEITGAIAVGWIGISVVMAISTFYIVTHGSAALSYLYWYGSGIVAARRMRLALA